MKDGFVKVGVCSPDLKVADPLYNCAKMVEKAEVLSGRGAKLVAFPELSLTGDNEYGNVETGVCRAGKSAETEEKKAL